MKLLATLPFLALTVAIPVDESNKLISRAEVESYIRSGKRVCGDFQRPCCDGYYCANSLDPCPNSQLCDLFAKLQPCNPGVKPCCNGFCPRNDNPKNCPLYCIPNTIKPPPIN